MTRTLPLFAALVAGCSTAVVPAPAPPLPAAPQPPAAGIDFAGWPSVTEHPIPVEWLMMLFCEAPRPERVEAERKKHGPHFKPAVVVRTNPEALETFRAGRGAMPVGTTVVKEKHGDPTGKTFTGEYGAMVKREAGYDPAHGDWEYVYVAADKTVTRGILATCIDCHSQVAEKDYLFRTYLKK